MKAMRTRSSGKLSMNSSFQPRQKRASATKKKIPKRAKRKSNAKSITRPPKTSFTDLDDDCIEEILRRLHAVELCKFTILSKRLKSIAESVFKRLYASKTFTFRPTETCATEFGCKIIRLFMESFGSYMQQIQVIGTESSAEKRMERKMLSSIGENCGPNLKSLNLVKLDLNVTSIALLQKTLNSVPQITLDSCRLANRNVDVYEMLLKKCHLLRTLNIIQCNTNTFNHTSWLRRKYHRLETVQVLRAIFEPEDVEIFFKLNPQLCDVWFNVRLPRLTHPYDRDYLQRYLMINGFDEGNYCQRFLNTYSNTIVIKSLTLGHNMLTHKKCMSISQMKDMRELKLIEVTELCADFVSLLSTGLENLVTVFLSGTIFDFQIICDFITKFPRLQYIYLQKTGFDAISNEQFAKLIATRNRNATIETEHLTIFVGRSTPVYARTIWRKFKQDRSINVITMKSSEFQSLFFLTN